METTLFLRLQQSIAKFYLALDSGKPDEASSYFHESGQWNRKNQILTGTEAVREALSKRDEKRITCHSISNLIVEENNGLYVATYYLVVYDNSGELSPNPATVLLAKDEWVEVNGQLFIKNKSSTRHL